jgi:hypothetical protein
MRMGTLVEYLLCVHEKSSACAFCVIIIMYLLQPYAVFNTIYTDKKKQLKEEI